MGARVRSRQASGRWLLWLVVLTAMLAALPVAAAPAAQAQIQEPTLTVTPSTVPEPGVYEFTVVGSDWTAAPPIFVLPCEYPDDGIVDSVDAATCNTSNLTPATPDNLGRFAVTVTYQVPAEGLAIIAGDSGQTEAAGALVSIEGNLPGRGESGATIAMNANGQTVMGAVKQDGTLYTRTRNSGNEAWGAWVRHGRSDWTSVSVDIADDGQIWLAGVKEDGRLYVRRFDGSQWGSWTKLGLATWAPNKAPSITANNDGMKFAALKLDGRLYTRGYDLATGWSAWQQLPGTFDSADIDMSADGTSSVAAIRRSGELVLLRASGQLRVWPISLFRGSVVTTSPSVSRSDTGVTVVAAVSRFGTVHTSVSSDSDRAPILVDSYGLIDAVSAHAAITPTGQYASVAIVTSSSDVAKLYTDAWTPGVGWSGSFAEMPGTRWSEKSDPSIALTDSQEVLLHTSSTGALYTIWNASITRHGRNTWKL